MFNKFLKITIFIVLCSTNCRGTGFNIAMFFNEVYKNTAIEPMAQNTMNFLANPLSKAAKQKHLAVHVISNPTPNAFATLKQRMFVFTGLIKLLPEAGQCAGVIAHEIGHLANKHMCKGINSAIKTQKGALEVSRLILSWMILIMSTLIPTNE